MVTTADLSLSRLDLDTAAAAGHAQALAALPTVSIVPTDSPTEDGIFTLSINAPAPAVLPVVVNFTTTGSTVTSGTDYNLVAGTNLTALTASSFTIAAEQTTDILKVSAPERVTSPGEKDSLRSVTEGTLSGRSNSTAPQILISNVEANRPPEFTGQDADRVVLWNKLGSNDEIQNSEIGADGVIVGTSYAFEAAQYDDGYIRKATGQNYLKFPKTVIEDLRYRGSVELWINPKVPNPQPYSYGIFGLIGAPYGHGGVPSSSPIHLEWGDTVTGRGISGGLFFGGQNIYTPPEPTQFVTQVGVPFQVAMCWDLNGIDGTADKIRVYRNGEVIGATTSSWNPTGTFQDDLILGYGPDGGGSNKFITDNLVFWDYAKTDYSNRFIEDPRAGGLGFFTIAENSPKGTVISTLAANDPDGDTLTYAITLGNPDLDGDTKKAFAINSVTGQITVNDSDELDFETTPTFNLSVSVIDPSGLSDTATVTVNLSNVFEELVGTSGDDDLTGTNEADSILGLAGADIIQGLAGADTISGGLGNDLITADDGNDSVTGDAGDDHLLGGTGNDTLNGGAGRDSLLGEAGNDSLLGGVGNDILTGGEGNDTVDGGADTDRLLGDAGNDALSGGGGNDTLTGDAGNDALLGGDGNDLAQGGEGNDNLAGGLGDDRLLGGKGNDSLSGNDGQDALTGGFGNDSLSGGAGNDSLVGVEPTAAGSGVGFGAGEIDNLRGDSGRDTFVLGDVNRVYYSDGNALTTGESDYALIQDFKTSEDVIQLKGSAAQYRLDFFTSGTSIDAALIYDPGVSARGEVIGILKNVSPNLSLTSAAFQFVPSPSTTATAAAASEQAVPLVQNLTAPSSLQQQPTQTASTPSSVAVSDANTTGPILNPANGHYYEFVSDQRITWTDAKVAAESKTFNGSQGYLVTITSQIEQDFLFSNFGEILDGWMGASDAEQEGLWKWVTGPEAGLAFWSGGVGGTPINGAYEDWGWNEPNDNTGEDYALWNFGGYGGTGVWGDFPTRDDVLSGVSGYIAEYSPPIVITPIIGTPGNDVLSGTNGADSILGLAGADVLQGLAGADTLSGGTGNDLVSAGDGDDKVTGDEGNDNLLGGTGNDTLDGGAGKDSLLGQAGNDSLLGGDGNDRLNGGDGNDSLNGGICNDTLLGEAGNDLLLGDVGDDSAVGGDGDDTLAAGLGQDRLFGGTGNDSLSGNDGHDTLTGGLGNDSLVGGSGNDTLIGVEPTVAGSGVGFGAGEVDIFRGDTGRDSFVLGDASRVYYSDGDPLTSGESDYALITDFNSSQDVIQLKGSASLYLLDFYTSNSRIDAALISDPGVSARGEVIGILQNVSSSLSLTSPAFSYV